MGLTSFFLNNGYLGNHITENLHGSNYVFNSFGHRCKEIYEINQDDYLLYAGCSHTVGYGLELEETFPYISACLLNKDYYNLSLGGSGFDVLQHNLGLFLANYKKPKALIVQAPYYTRFMREVVEDKSHSYIGFEGTWSDNLISKFQMMGDDIGFFSLKLKLFKIFLDHLNIPIITIEIEMHQTEFYPNSLKLLDLDFSRDNLHLGIKSHTKLAYEIANRYNELHDKYLNARDNNDIRGQKQS